jgi:Tol biopolymer transport system component
VARTNGREFRRLTDDESRDRAPAWSPDGRRLAFYSDRGGGYQVWTIRPDGSGLEQLTQIEGSANFPIWARDGRTIAVGVNPGSWYQVDLGAPESPKPARRMPALDETSAMWPLAWSPDGARLAGIQIRFDGTIASVLTFDLVRATYAVVAEADDPAWKAVVWLPDSRRLLVRDRRGISLVDGKTMRRLIPIGGYWIGRSLDIARDGRWISYTETGTEGDIWLAELRQGESQ